MPGSPSRWSRGFWLRLVWGLAPGYNVVKTYKLGGDEGGGYLTVDDPSNRLQVSRSTDVMSKSCLHDGWHADAHHCQHAG